MTGTKTKRSFPLWIWGTLVFIIISVGFLLKAYSLQSDFSETYPVDIYAAGHHFQIPRNYLTSWDKENKQNTLAAVIDVLLPDLEFRTKENNDLWSPWHKRLLHFSINKKEEPVRKFDLSSKGSSLGNLKFDTHAYELYKAHGMQNVNYIGTKELDYFLSKDGYFLLSCSGPPNPKATPQCSSYGVSVLGNVGIYVSFDSKHFDEFPTIIKKVENFLSQHQVK